MVQIVLLSILLGYGLCRTAKEYNNIPTIRNRLEIGLDIFRIINNKILFFMPVGVFFLMYNQFQKIDYTILYSLLLLIGAVILSLICMIILCICVIMIMGKVGFTKFFKIFSETIFIVVTTISSLVALPKAIESLKQLDFKADIVEMYMPFGVAFLRIGTISFFLISSLFFIEMFNIDITIEKLFFIVIYSVIAAISTVGASSIVAVQMIGIVLGPFGIDTALVIPILLIINSIVDIPVTLVNVLSNSAIVAFICPSSEEKNLSNTSMR